MAKERSPLIKTLIDAIKRNAGGDAKSIVANLMRLKIKERLKAKREDFAKKVLNK